MKIRRLLVIIRAAACKSPASSAYLPASQRHQPRLSNALPDKSADAGLVDAVRTRSKRACASASWLVAGLSARRR